MGVAMGPWGSTTYTGTLTLPAEGTYDFFTAYQRFDGTWNTSIPTDPGVINAVTITVAGYGSCTTNSLLPANSLLERSQGTRPLSGVNCSISPPDTPSPANGASNVGLAALLSWSGGTAASSYQLYFGSSNPPPFLATVSGNSYGLGLNANTTYFWYVVPNLSGATASNTWSFTTTGGVQAPGVPTNLWPGNGTANVSLTPTLTWSPASGAANYLVYFGTTNPPYAAGRTGGASYSPGQLGGNTTFYWRVVAQNALGSTSSAIISFTTMTSPAFGPVLVSGLSNPMFITSDSSSLYWSEANGLIRKVAKAGGSPTNLSVNGTIGTHLAVDDTSVYFGDGSSLRAVPKGGGSERILAAYNPTGIATDSGNVYWTEYGNGAIRKVGKSGGAVTTLATGSNRPVGIATDGEYVYWSEASSPGYVWKVSVNGGAITFLGYNVNNDGVAIDDGNVYWGEYVYADQGSIDKVAKYGGAITKLATGLNQVWNVATDGASVFWVENRTGGAVKQVSITGSGPVTLADNLSEPVALTVDSSNVYWIERNGGGTASGTLKMSPKAPTVQVTVGTSPSGRSFQVDGVSYTLPQTFVWLSGSSHTITANSQAGFTGAQYIWQSWSDGGASSHSVYPTFNASYVASFGTQYYLTASANQGGAISPPSNWYDAGTVLPISAVAASGYTFVGFSGDMTGTVTPQNLAMDGPHTVTASFTASPALRITGAHTGNFTQGQSGATYTVTVSNQAFTGPTSGTVTVTETVPLGLTLVSMVGAGWACPTGGNTCTRNDALAAGVGYPPITVTVNVAANAISPQVNGISVSGGAEILQIPATLRSSSPLRCRRS